MGGAPGLGGSVPHSWRSTLVPTDHAEFYTRGGPRVPQGRPGALPWQQRCPRREPDGPRQRGGPRGALSSPKAGPGQRRQRDAAAGAVPGAPLRRRRRDRLSGGGPGAVAGTGSSRGEGVRGGTRGTGAGRPRYRRRGPSPDVDAAGREPRAGEWQPGPGQDRHGTGRDRGWQSIRTGQWPISRKITPGCLASRCARCCRCPRRGPRRAGTTAEGVAAPAERYSPAPGSAAGRGDPGGTPGQEQGTAGMRHHRAGQQSQTLSHLGARKS